MRNAAAENGIRMFLVRDTASIEWLTAFDGVFDDEQAHALLVTPHDAVLHTDSRYSGAARKAAQGEGVVAVDDARQGHGEWVADVFTARHASAPAGSPAPESIVLGVEDSMTRSRAPLPRRPRPRSCLRPRASSARCARSKSRRKLRA